MRNINHTSNAVLTASILWSAQLGAETETSFQVSAAIESGCQISQSTPTPGADIGEIGAMEFPSASTTSTATNTVSLAPNAGFTLSCTPGLQVTMQVDGGIHFDSARNMQHDSVADTISYSLFEDAALSQPIGVGVPISLDSNSDPGNISLPIYGQVTLPGNVQAGTYSDLLTVTLEW